MCPNSFYLMWWVWLLLTYLYLHPQPRKKVTMMIQIVFLFLLSPINLQKPLRGIDVLKLTIDVHFLTIV